MSGDCEIKEKQIVCPCGMLTVGIVSVTGMTALKKQIIISKLRKAAKKTGYILVLGDVENCGKCGRSFKDDPVEHVNIDKDGNETTGSIIADG